MATEFNEINLTTKSKLEISSNTPWNMNTPEFNENLDIEEIAKYLAKVSQKIIIEMKKQDEDQTNFEEVIQEMKNRSQLEQEKNEEKFNERKRQLREKFRRRR